MRPETQEMALQTLLAGAWVRGTDGHTTAIRYRQCDIISCVLCLWDSHGPKTRDSHGPNPGSWPSCATGCLRCACISSCVDFDRLVSWRLLTSLCASQSRAGTLAFFLAGTAAALASLLYASTHGLVAQKVSMREAVFLSAACSAVGAAVESLPLPCDNLTVAAAVALAGHMLCRT